MKIVACVLVVLIVVGYWGLHVGPRPFEPYPQTPGELKTVPLPAGLPAPVERFYQTTYGDRVPVVETAVMSARGAMRLFHVRFPMRIRMIHQAGQGYYTTIQPTFFGYPVVTWLDTYISGVAHVDMPPGIPDNHPKMNASSNLALWAESVDLPSIFLTDPRVRWEAIDGTHARLVVPSPDGEASFTVTFDRETGGIRSMEVPRWRGPEDTTKSVWRTGANGAAGTAAWNDEAPWFEMQMDQVVYNVDVSHYFTAPAR